MTCIRRGGGERGLSAMCCPSILNSVAAPLHLLAECWHVGKCIVRVEWFPVVIMPGRPCSSAGHRQQEEMAM